MPGPGKADSRPFQVKLYIDGNGVSQELASSDDFRCLQIVAETPFTTG
jgi:hypothetical protein